MELPVFEGVVQIPLQATERHFWIAVHPEGDALKPTENPSVSTDLDTYAGANQYLSPGFIQVHGQDSAERNKCLNILKNLLKTPLQDWFLSKGAIFKHLFSQLPHVS